MLPLRQIFLTMITFGALGLDARLIQATDALGFQHPTPIQEKAIPVLLSGTRDLVGLAQTGTGKTAAFGLPLLQLVDEKHVSRRRWSYVQPGTMYTDR